MVSRNLAGLSLLLVFSQFAFAGADEVPSEQSGAQASANTPSDKASGTAAVFDDVVTMTWVSGDKRFATIDGHFLAPGADLPDAGKVRDIRPGSVLIERNGESRWVDLVDEPPALADPFAAAEAPLTPLSYLDEAIDRLGRDIDALSVDPANRERIAQLEALRERLQSSREVLQAESDSGANTIAAEAGLSDEWLVAQQDLDALRERVLRSPGALDLDQLAATRTILERAMLSTLREPLSRLQDPEFRMAETAHSGDLLRMVGELLGQYPDYQALADQIQSAQPPN